eukprot:1403081-Rhodomonas_salina.2
MRCEHLCELCLPRLCCRRLPLGPPNPEPPLLNVSSADTGDNVGCDAQHTPALGGAAPVVEEHREEGAREDEARLPWTSSSSRNVSISHESERQSRGDEPDSDTTCSKESEESMTSSGMAPSRKDGQRSWP